VALARAIALDPSLLMYDEPFTGQDPIALGVLLSLIKNLNQALRTTSLVVSHDVRETLRIADYVYVIADGVVMGQGSPESIASHESDRVQQFIHGSPDGPVPFHYPADDFVYDILEDAAG
jgi:phospholipid/cholesterol/gamma-HCH transport system ATP-binding protein